MRLPGFNAEASVSVTEVHHYTNRSTPFSSPHITAAYNDCPGCRRFCDPCNQCLRAGNRYCPTCNSCWACDCAPQWHPRL